MSDERCEPPKELRGVDKLVCALAACDVEVAWTGKDGIMPQAASVITSLQSDLAAAKEREAALVGALKDIAGAGVYGDGLLSNADLARLTLDQLFPNWRTAP